MGERAPSDADERDHSPGNADGRSSGAADERTHASTDERDPAPDRTNATARAFAGADDPLVGWALAAFHTAILVALLVAGLHASGALGDLLGGLDTLIGFALFVVLWGLTWWTNRRWLAVVADPETDASASVVVGTGGKWGGIDGVCFLWVLLGGFALVNIGDFDLVGALYFLLLAAIGSLLALGIGGIIGALLAALDVALFRVADRVAPNEE